MRLLSVVSAIVSVYVRFPSPFFSVFACFLFPSALDLLSPPATRSPCHAVTSAALPLMCWARFYREYRRGDHNPGAHRPALMQHASSGHGPLPTARLVAYSLDCLRTANHSTLRPGEMTIITGLGKCMMRLHTNSISRDGERPVDFSSLDIIKYNLVGIVRS